jgi:hypothetical protein
MAKNPATSNELGIGQRVAVRKAVFQYHMFSREPLRLSIEEVFGTSADKIQIDSKAETFTVTVSAGLIFRGAPWDLLKAPPPSPILDMPYKGEIDWRPFDPDMRDHSAIPGLNMRRAAEAAWNHLVEKFNEGVSEGKILLWARSKDIAAPITRVPADIWPLFHVVDWKIGSASGPNGAHLWSVHAELLAGRRKLKAGRKPVYDLDHVIGVVRRMVKQRGGLPSSDGDVGWQSEADIHAVVADWFMNTIQKVPAKSTLQRLVKLALAKISSD